MNEDLHNIDDLFRKALEENRELPTDSVWDNIDKTLDKKKVVSISKKYNRLKWAAAALLLFSIGMAMYTLHVRRQNSELVKQNREGKNGIKQNSQNKIDAVDSLSTARIKILPSENTNNFFESQKKQIKADSTTADDKINDTNERSVANKQGKEENSLPFTHNDSILSTGNPNETMSLLNQKKRSVRNASAAKIKINLANIDSANAAKNYNPDLNETNIDENIAAKRELKSNIKNYVVAGKEKNNDVYETVPELKDDFPISTRKPVIQIDKKIQSAAMAYQNNNASISKKYKINSVSNSPFSATAFFSPDIVSTSLKDDHPRFREEERDAIEKDEQLKFSSTFGVLLDYNIGKNWKLESGLTYSSRKTDIRPKTIYARPDNDGNINYRFNCSAGYSYVTVKSSPPPASGDSIDALASTNNLQYVGLPLYAKYIFTAGRFSILPGAGISFNFLTKGKIETTIASPTGSKIPSTDKIQGLKSMYLNGAISVGLQYRLSKGLSLSFEPAFRFAISSINKDASVKTNLNSIGLSTGIVFKL